MAVIQLLCGHVPRGKQQAQCLKFLIEQGWVLTAIVPVGAADQTIQLIVDDSARTVLMSHVTDESREIERRAIEAGGKVAYCRGRPNTPPGETETTGVVKVLYRHGRAPGQIAEFLKIPLERVLRVLGITDQRRQ